MNGDSGNDTLKGTGSSDTIKGWSGDDTIYGYSGSDSLYGNVGDDKIYGGDGDDILNGPGGSEDDPYTENYGGGSATLTGGDGADRFICSPDAYEEITDYSQSEGDMLENEEHCDEY